MIKQFQFEYLWTDILLYLVVVLLSVVFMVSLRKLNVRRAWRSVFQRPLAMASFLIVISFLGVALLDSIHYHKILPQQINHHIHYSPKTYSLLDDILAPIGERHEKTYSAPFSLNLFAKEFITDSKGITHNVYPRLSYADMSISDQIHAKRIVFGVLIGLIKGSLIWLTAMILIFTIAGKFHLANVKSLYRNLFLSKSIIAWKTLFLMLLIILLISNIALTLATDNYIFGTDKVGQDVFYLAVKSIRTGIVIGTITTMSMLPFALLLGIAAGYFGGIVDAVIQYIYTTISSIPGVLLITAAILSMQIFITTHPQFFNSLAQVADARLLALCVILGFTSWTSLCRLLRAETLKIRESDYIQAAKALGSSTETIIFRHIIPNVMHIILITTVLDFSFLVLAEALLSYVGVGVSPTTISWGNMINSARLELAREPVVWWPMLAAFSFMFVLVLSGNIFADAVRDAFDPRAKITE